MQIAKKPAIITFLCNVTGDITIILLFSVDCISRVRQVDNHFQEKWTL